ncbi:hypothetical protein ES708_11268 [subsurface metagenome]
MDTISFPENPPFFIKAQIEKAIALDMDFLTSRAEQYFAVSVKLHAIEKNNWKKRSVFWGPLLSLIPFLIEWWAQRDHVRRELPVENFPEIKEMTIEYAVRGLKGQMKNVQELIQWYPDLKPWVPILVRSMRIANISERTKNILKVRSSISQRDLQTELHSEDKRTVSHTLKYMEKYGIIRRTKEDRDWLISLIS